MKVILQENVDGVGHLGDLLDVSDGFARNYLLPRQKAMEANPRNVKAFEHAKRTMAEKARKEKLEIENLAKKVSAVSLTIMAQVGKDDKLFGSVTAKDVAEGLAAHGFTVDRRKIQLAQPIKELGTHTVAVKLHRDVTASVSVSVRKKQDAATASEPGGDVVKETSAAPAREES
jgi:large subunit ribosomal protein L9